MKPKKPSPHQPSDLHRSGCNESPSRQRLAKLLASLIVARHRSSNNRIKHPKPITQPLKRKGRG